MKLRFGILAGIFLAAFSLYPQMRLVYLRGGISEWQGNYAYNDVDEVAYASYVAALIDGRPRKNDPYTGRDDSPEHPQPESLFSIQFAAPYTLAIPARVLGVGAPMAMIVGGAVAAFLAALALFWLLFGMTGSNWYAFAGSLVTLAGGALFAGEGAISEILFGGYPYPYFPGFRRYVPAVVMPVFFALLAVIWWALNVQPGVRHVSGSGRQSWRDGALLMSAALVVLLFAFAVFSYFYVWTTAAAWLGCLVFCILAARLNGFRCDLRFLALVAAGCGAVLVPYAYLLSKRAPTMDHVQLLVRTHAPDLNRFPIYISLLVLLILTIGFVFRRFSIRERGVLFVLSLALSVLVVFNQQVLSGRSLQPVHYQVFIGNYVSGLALVGVFGLLVKDRNWVHGLAARLAFGAIAAAAIVWGFVECHHTTRVLDEVNVARDQQMAVAGRLNELSKLDPKPYRTVVLHFGISEADDLPTVAPQATLWARHQHVFAGVGWQENKERYYQYLYFMDITPEQLSAAMRKGDFVSIIALFGWGRHTDRLNANYKPLTFAEINAEALAYGEYIRNFNPVESPETVISYVVVPDYYYGVDFENLDRWYQRDAGERLGPFTLYRVALK